MKIRQDKINNYGLEIVVANEKYWLKLGYKIDYKNDRLIKLKEVTK